MHEALEVWLNPKVAELAARLAPKDEPKAESDDDDADPDVTPAGDASDPTANALIAHLLRMAENGELPPGVTVTTGRSCFVDWFEEDLIPLNEDPMNLL